MKSAILTIKHPRAVKVINLSDKFFYDNKNRLLTSQKIHEKVLSIVQDEFKIKYVDKNSFTFKLLK
jgi:hypothetical protein